VHLIYRGEAKPIRRIYNQHVVTVVTTITGTRN